MRIRSSGGHFELIITTGNYHAYLRGRHLHGTSQPLPQGYTGAVLSVTDKQLQQSRPKPQAIEDDEDGGENAVEEQDVEVYIAEQVGEFDEFIVWGHGGQVDGAQDGYVRGMKEWITFSESMHVDDEEHVATEKKYS